VTFPVYINIGPLHLHPHHVFEILAYALGYQAYRQARRKEDFLGDGPRWMLLAAAAMGALIGSRLMEWLADPASFHSGTWSQLLQAKTVVGGLIGGTLAVEYYKPKLGISERTGDPLAAALALAIGIGRWGCFLTGLSDHTYGNPSSLPWAIDMGDSIPRHPVALYESIFCLSLAWLLHSLQGRLQSKGDLFRIFMLSYFTWRFFVEFIKPGPSWFGLNGYQWASLAVCFAYRRDAVRLFRSLRATYA
jgi:phosphatidylglycerol---prolipoprotein diacylglyceryl transferase